MELNVFIKELEGALISRGVPESAAARHVDKLGRSLGEDDLSEINAMTSSEEIDALADSISAILNRPRNTPVSGGTDNFSIPAADTSEKNSPPAEKAAVSAPVATVEDEFFDFGSDSNVTTKGMTIFWCGLFVTLPITLVLLAVIFGAFLVGFATLGGLIVGSIAVMIALIAGGAVCSLVGIIYGISQLFSFVEAGIYEIGLGIIVAGVVFLLSILIYNFAIRFLPWVVNKLGTFLGFVCRKLKDLFRFVRKECYRL